MASHISELLADIAGAAPHLAGAACVGRWELFDIDDRDDPRIGEAIEVCQTCPALTGCRAWLDSLTRAQRPSGVVAGKFVPPRKLEASRQPTKRTVTKQRPTKTEAAANWLAEYLRAHGPTSGRDVIAAAAAAGIRRGTLFAARSRLGVVAPPRHGLKAHESPVWSLPETRPECPQNDEKMTEEVHIP